MRWFFSFLFFLCFLTKFGSFTNLICEMIRELSISIIFIAVSNVNFWAFKKSIFGNFSPLFCFTLGHVNTQCSI
uniref:Secreted protein n=1 Tax=Panstrongylus lignarius TaxID=156445 RepID=A0A224XXF7_9HEMI